MRAPLFDVDCKRLPILVMGSFGERQMAHEWDTGCSLAPELFTSVSKVMSSVVDQLRRAERRFGPAPIFREVIWQVPVTRPRYFTEGGRRLPQEYSDFRDQCLRSSKEGLFLSPVRVLELVEMVDPCQWDFRVGLQGLSMIGLQRVAEKWCTTMSAKWLELVRQRRNNILHCCALPGVNPPV
jgi:hypothetical protein